MPENQYYLLQTDSISTPYYPCTYSPMPADGGPDLTFSYSIVMQDGSAVPSWFDWDPVNELLIVKKNGFAEVKTHEFYIVCSVDGYP